MEASFVGPMSEFEFKPYLSTIATHYDQWWRLYTLSDAEGKQAEAKGQFFEFGLMVERREERRKREEGREKTEDGREKVERLDVLAGLRKYAAEHVLLVGRPGSGKSTALARLMLETSGDGGWIPVLVELRSWQSSIFELICNSCKRHGLVLSIAQVQALLDDRKLLLLIDGVNELPSEAARTDVGNFRRNHPKVPMIFTTRDLSLGGDLGIEKKLEMQALTEEQMRSFVLAYLPEQGEVMLRQLQGRLREMGQTPLLLWMLCSLFRRAEVIPANLGEVFRMFTQGYERQIKQDVVVEGDRRWWPGLLQELAARMMNPLVGARIPRPEALRSSVEFRVAIPPSEIESIFTEYFQDKETQPAGAARKALNDLLKHHLIQRNGDLVEFRHQLIQEYYAAEWLLVRVGDLDDDTLKRDYLNHLKWTEPVALMLALVDDEGLAVRVVERSLEVDLMLGARLAGEVRSELHDRMTALIIQIIDEKQLTTNLKVELLERKRSCTSLVSLSLSRCLREDATKLINEIGIEIAISRLVNIIENAGKSFESYGSIILLREIREISVEQFSPLFFKRIKCSSPSIRKMLESELSEEVCQRVAALSLSQSEDANRTWHSRTSGEINSITPEDMITRFIGNSRSNKVNVLRDLSTALSKNNLETAIPLLLKMLEEPNKGSAGIAVNILSSFKEDRAAHILPHLLTLQPTKFCQQALTISQGIQANCKFYNYEIFHSPPVKPQPTQQSPPATTINQFPNATEVKIFEHVQTYQASPPRDPPR